MNSFRLISFFVFVILLNFGNQNLLAYPVTGLVSQTPEVTVEEFLNYERDDLENALGRRSKFTERIALKQQKRKLKRQLQKGKVEKSDLVKIYKFKFFPFFLGMCFSTIGILGLIFGTFIGPYVIAALLIFGLLMLHKRKSNAKFIHSLVNFSFGVMLPILLLGIPLLVLWLISQVIFFLLS